MGELMDSVMRAGPETIEVRVGPDAVLAWTARPLRLEAHDWPKGWPGGPGAPTRELRRRGSDWETVWHTPTIDAHVLWRRGTLEGVVDLEAAEALRARLLTDGIDGVPVVPGTDLFEGGRWTPLDGGRYSRVDWLRRGAAFAMAGAAEMPDLWPTFAASYAVFSADPWSPTETRNGVRWTWGGPWARLSPWLREQPVMRAAWLGIVEHLAAGPGDYRELATRFGVVDP